MSAPSRFAYLAIAIGLHAAILWGVSFGPPAFISDESEQDEAVEVGLVESMPEAASELAPAPVVPDPPLEPPPPEPPAPDPEPLPPPPDAMTDPALPSEPPKPVPKPAPKPKPRNTPKTAAPSAATTATTGLATGNPNAGAGQPRSGDRSHATWRNRIKPAYPEAARAAKQTGRVFIVVNVNALGECTAARVFTSSGFASLDQAALGAARASTFNPRQVLGIPLPDTITVPYSFQLD